MLIFRFTTESTTDDIVVESGQKKDADEEFDRIFRHLNPNKGSRQDVITTESTTDDIVAEYGQKKDADEEFDRLFRHLNPNKRSRQNVINNVEQEYNALVKSYEKSKANSHAETEHSTVKENEDRKHKEEGRESEELEELLEKSHPEKND